MGQHSIQATTETLFRRHPDSTLQSAWTKAQSYETFLRRAELPPDPLGIWQTAMPHRGKVVAVHHAGALHGDKYQTGPVRKIVEAGVRELTGTDTPLDAWRQLFSPGDIVGIKLNAAGRPYLISAPELLIVVVDWLVKVGIKKQNIVVYDRWRIAFLEAGFHSWLPEGVRWVTASERHSTSQMDMDGYDPDLYLEMPLIHPVHLHDFRPDDPHIRRSYVSRFAASQVSKIINICVLKHHQAAGVSLALKNLSHGLVNNVSRSHPSRTANVCASFIPAIVSLPTIRDKVVLHILDGVKAAYHGGPGPGVANYLWNHGTMYFATDPVALDKVGRRIIDQKRIAMGRKPVALVRPDEDGVWTNCQVEYIELAGYLGLGEYRDGRVNVQLLDLTEQPA